MNDYERDRHSPSPADADIRGSSAGSSKDAAAAWQCVPWPWLTESFRREFGVDWTIKPLTDEEGERGRNALNGEPTNTMTGDSGLVIPPLNG